MKPARLSPLARASSGMVAAERTRSASSTARSPRSAKALRVRDAGGLHEPHEFSRPQAQRESAFASGRDGHDAPDSRDRGLDIGDRFDGAAIALPVELRAVGIEPMRVGATFVLEAR